MDNSTSVWRKDVVGWTLYDFANTIYSMNIVSLYLKRYIIEDLGKDDRYFDIPFSVSMLVAAVLLPALGAMSDHSTKKKLFVFLFTLSCCAAVGLMAFVPASMLILTIMLFIVANFSYEAGQPFYNALLYSVADGQKARFVSGAGVALGYVGSAVGTVVGLAFVTGEVFSINIPFLEGGGKVASFLPTAFLFMLFSLPLFWWVREAKITVPRRTNFRQSYREVWEGVTATRKYPGVLRFLISDYFFEDSAMTVIINIGLYCSIVIGFREAHMHYFLMISIGSAVLGSFIMGKVAEHWSLKKLLILIIWGWIISLATFVFTNSVTVVWILGSIIGILLGGLWTTTRPLLAELVPRAELGRFFGLFSLSGRAAAIIGPLVWTTIVYLFNADRVLGKMAVNLLDIHPDDYVKLPYKMAVLSLSLIMLIGLYIFRKVPDTHGREDAEESR
ncbi:MAG: MFS transporter [Candidatus Zixiibacteriota bacterium]|nr:MAG: MFS transporter [candidate division Zixibacteria bacterium]